MEINKVYCMDNVEGMSLLDEESIDLTVTSPPYDNLRKYDGFQWNFEGVANQLFRVTKQGGVVVWVVGDATVKGSETGTSFRQALYFMSLGFNLHDTMIYRKLNGAMGSKYTYLQEFEYMFIFSKGFPKTVNFLRDRKNVKSKPETTLKTKSDKEGPKTERHLVEPQEYGRRKNIWDYAVGGKQEFESHPGIFPDKLAQDHILSWSNPDDLVLDPFSGSGTTLKMAKINKRNFIGFDISQDYCDIANKRIEEAK